MRIKKNYPNLKKELAVIRIDGIMKPGGRMKGKFYTTLETAGLILERLEGNTYTRKEIEDILKESE